MKHKVRGKSLQKPAFLSYPEVIKKISSSSLLMFLIRFNIFAIPLYFILLTGMMSEPLMQLTTQLAFVLLRATGISASLNDNIISVSVSNGSFGAYVSWDSTGWKSMLALAALIFATSFSLRKKLFGLLLLPVVYCINILRIWFMFFIVTIDASYFELAHLTIWSWGLIFTILLLWIVWMKFVGRKEPNMFGADKKLKKWNESKDRERFR